MQATMLLKTDEKSPLGMLADETLSSVKRTVTAAPFAEARELLSSFWAVTAKQDGSEWA
jgi:hypothetical protein